MVTQHMAQAKLCKRSTTMPILRRTPVAGNRVATWLPQMEEEREREVDTVHW
jgi:hypothetical protein